MLNKTLALGFVFSIFLAADEGMWLFDNFPKIKFGRPTVSRSRMIFWSISNVLRFDLTTADRVRSCRLTACSSPITTSARTVYKKLSAAEHDYMTKGFSTAAEAEEKTCPRPGGGCSAPHRGRHSPGERRDSNRDTPRGS